MGNLSIRRRDGVNLVPTGHEMEKKNSPHQVRFCRDQDRNYFVLIATHIQLRSGRIDSRYEHNYDIRLFRLYIETLNYILIVHPS